MRIDLLSGGLTALTLQGATPENKIIFSKFQLATDMDFVTTPSIPHAVGEILYEGTAESMKFCNINDNSCVLQLEVDRDQPQGVIGNAVIFVIYDGVEYPFAIIRPANGERNIKLQSAESHFGMDYFVQILIDIPQLTSRFDFTNMAQGMVELKLFSTELDVTGAFETVHDQAVIEYHSMCGGRLVPIFNSENLWFGIPYAVRLEETQIIYWNGGYMGDDYAYTPNLIP